MKNIKRIVSLVLVSMSLSGIGASAATIDSKEITPIKNSNSTVPINITLQDIKNSSKIIVDSIPEKLVDRVAYLTYKGTKDSSGNSFSYSLTIEVPYTTFEDNNGKIIYSVDDSNIVAYLSNYASFSTFKLSYASSSKNSSGSRATIKGFGDVSGSYSVGGVTFNSNHQVNFSVTLLPSD
jgi:hypothetical protein